MAAASRPMSKLVSHGRELRPNTSFNRTRCGSPRLAPISFWAKRGLPQGAGYLERSARKEALGRAILAGGRGIPRIAVSGWRRSASDGSPPATSWRDEKETA